MLLNISSCSGVISIHASHAGRDLRTALYETSNPFQSTRPMRDATSMPLNIILDPFGFQSTRPMRDATFELARSRVHLLRISIHASHAGRDHEQQEYLRRVNKISIHASHAGRDSSSVLYIQATFISIHASHAGRDLTSL